MGATYSLLFQHPKLNQFCMSLKHDSEVKALHERITRFSTHLEKMAKESGESLKDLIINIHKPGWTTPVEWMFTKVVFQNLEEQLNSIEKQLQGFSKATKMVGMKEMAEN